MTIGCHGHHMSVGQNTLRGSRALLGLPVGSSLAVKILLCIVVAGAVFRRRAGRFGSYPLAVWIPAVQIESALERASRKVRACGPAEGVRRREDGRLQVCVRPLDRGRTHCVPRETRGFICAVADGDGKQVVSGVVGPSRSAIGLVCQGGPVAPTVISDRPREVTVLAIEPLEDARRVPLDRWGPPAASAVVVTLRFGELRPACA